MENKNQNMLPLPKSVRPGLKRLSSMTSTKEDVSEAGANVVVVPHRFMLRRAHSYSTHGFAASLGKAREELSTMNLEGDSPAPLSSPETPGTPMDLSTSPATSSPPQSPMTPISPSCDLPSADTFAFAFDIDGVLVRGGKAIPEAIEAMKMLNGENEYGVKV